MKFLMRKHFPAPGGRKMSKLLSKVVVIAVILLFGTLALQHQDFVGAQSTQANVQSKQGSSHTTTLLANSNANPNMYAVVYDVTHHRYLSYGTPNLFLTGSSMKVAIMLTFLDMKEREGRSLTSHEYYLLRTMIENSNNDSASELYYYGIGGAAGVTRYMHRIGITLLYPYAYAWGWSKISPLAMVQMLTKLYEGTILNTYDRHLAFYYMEHIEWDQRWGAGDTAPRGAVVAMKNGWVPGPDGLWNVNSSGIVMTSHETYIIATYTREQYSFGAGRALVQQVCGQVASQLG
jgi:beta-lactamase class A